MRCRACGAVVASSARFCDQCGTRLDAGGHPSAGRPEQAPALGDGQPVDRRSGVRARRGDRPADGVDDASPTGLSRTGPSPTGARAPGAAADASATGAPADPSATGAAGDRRVVTALFADLVDYVRLVAEHDAEEVRRRVDAALTLMSDAIARFDGTREKFIGDAVFAVFGWPVAHDDDALRATSCALAIRAGLGDLQDPAGESLQVRIGVATGEVVAAPRGIAEARDWSLTGPAVTTAARIQGVAEPGEILLDDATIRAARKGLTVVDLGERILRGQTRPVRIGRLVGDATFQPWEPPAGPFVGRVIERSAIQTAIHEFAIERRGGVVVVEGEAGIGKSRLLASAEADTRRAGLAWTWVDNVSYGATEAYRFARSLAQTIADEQGTDSGTFTRRLLFTDADPADVRRWAGVVAAMAREAAFAGWEEEAQLVPSDPQDVASGLRSVAVRYMERLLEIEGPRVIVVDDLQWLDPSSEGVFEELVATAGRSPLLVLVARRPDGPRLPSLDAPWVRTMSLTGLDEGETGDLARAVSRAEVDAADVRRLHARTGGNPLFIGETVRAIVDDGAITSDGRLEFGGMDRGAVPVTLRALLGSRIDALTPDTRTVLRVASVLGIRFSEAEIDGVLDEPVDATAYERLADAAMIVPTDAAGGWRFCHPLIHDAAYSSVLAADRRILHTRVADGIERGDLVGRVGIVARHRAAAGDGERAVPLLVQAAEEALAIGADAEAAGYFLSAARLARGGDADALRRRAEDARAEAPVGGR